MSTPATSSRRLDAHADLTGQPWSRMDAVVAIVLCVIAAAVFANTLNGRFVYDDAKQIVSNDLVRNPAMLGKALLSDVWAFRASAERAASLYWRPTFVFWLICNERVFGMNVVGWHVTNIALHAAVTAIAFGFLRWLGAGRMIAAGIGLLFAVHPVHVGTVAWISGSPDLLMSILLLPALWLTISAGRSRRYSLLVAACAFYVLGVGTKEVAVVFPALAFTGVWLFDTPSGDRNLRLRRAALIALPFACIAGVFLVIRAMILGGAGLSAPSSAGWVAVLYTWPTVVWFYLRQTFFPLWIGPAYPVRFVTSPGFWSFLVPLLLVTMAVIAARVIIARHALRILGAAVFVLILLPALNIRGFFLEHLVQDRYLYLPVLGALMVIVPVGAALAQRMMHDHKRGQLAALIACIIAAIPLAAQTWRYNTAWMSEEALWTWALKSDPTSAFNATQLGVVYLEAGRVDDAHGLFDRALTIGPYRNAYLGRSQARIEMKQYDGAIEDARRILDEHGPDYAAYERIAIAEASRGRLDEAEAVLREARERVPRRRIGLTVKLATVLYQAGRKDDAQRELEAVRGEITSEFGAEPRLALYRLALLLAEKRQFEGAVAVLREFMSLSETYQSDPEVHAAREHAKSILDQVH